MPEQSRDFAWRRQLLAILIEKGALALVLAFAAFLFGRVLEDYKGVIVRENEVQRRKLDGCEVLASDLALLNATLSRVIDESHSSAPSSNALMAQLAEDTLRTQGSLEHAALYLHPRVREYVVRAVTECDKLRIELTAQTRQDPQDFTLLFEEIPAQFAVKDALSLLRLSISKSDAEVDASIDAMEQTKKDSRRPSAAGN